MGRSELAQNVGMLFIFNETGYHSFWMKNTLIPLDMLRLDEKGKIVDIQSAVPCETPNQEHCPIYQPQQPAQYVLEINAGKSKKNTLHPGVECSLSKS